VLEANNGALVDVVLLVGGANVRENQWACLILVVYFQAAIQGLKDALLQRRSQVCESYLSTSGRRCCSLGSFGVEFRISV
jgi:hypothetical protein